ncbi:uncharacterized protein LOC117179994 [Belonocnema kinseyi]|uniref:uncharacterized protein LOC117179994 n=1 Tax=Belonocnema kinseyi TaxID=2817044 RepID=UPI00143CFBBF|nr:uncharacterized protein LOC117179994 [Belonocnema kinseyi]
MELSLLMLTLAFSSALGLNLDKKALDELSAEDQTLVHNEVNNFLDATGKQIAGALKLKNVGGESTVDRNIHKIKTRPVVAAVPHCQTQQWPIKNPAYCALINWMKWAIQTIKLVYEKGLDILRIHTFLNL